MKIDEIQIDEMKNDEIRIDKIISLEYINLI
jgi:hypothetical protein